MMSFIIHFPLVVPTHHVFLGVIIIYILIYSDINECQTDNGGCTQTCDNTDGSYQCSCLNGYELANDGHNCSGMYV